MNPNIIARWKLTGPGIWTQVSDDESPSSKRLVRKAPPFNAESVLARDNPTNFKTSYQRAFDEDENEEGRNDNKDWSMKASPVPSMIKNDKPPKPPPARTKVGPYIILRVTLLGAGPSNDAVQEMQLL